jgi:tetratricopeptide (TPR) repeat protein
MSAEPPHLIELTAEAMFMGVDAPLMRWIARRRVARADSARDRHNWADARFHYEKALALTPGRAEIWVQLGNANKENGAFEKAAEAYGRAVAIEPDAADTHLQIGHLRKLQGDLDAAAESYLRAIEIDQTCTDAASELRGLGWAPPRTDGQRLSDLEELVASMRESEAREADRLSVLYEAVEILRVMVNDLKADLVLMGSRMDSLADEAMATAEFGVELSSTRSILGKAFERLAVVEQALTRPLATKP